MIYGYYIGKDFRLRGKGALLMAAKHRGQIRAQFDDLTLTESIGWWEFHRREFKLRRSGKGIWNEKRKRKSK